MYLRNFRAVSAEAAVSVRAVEAVGRDHPRHQVHREIGRRGVEAPAIHQPVERRTLERTEPRSLRHPAPIGVERRPRARRAALHVAADQNGAIHRAGGRAGERLDLQPGLFEKPIEHAPGERAMRPPALKGQIHLDLTARGIARVPGSLRHGSPHRKRSYPANSR